MVSVSIVELNWNQHFTDKRAKLKICSRPHTAKQVISPCPMDENSYQKYKNENIHVQELKTSVFIPKGYVLNVNRATLILE